MQGSNSNNGKQVKQKKGKIQWDEQNLEENEEVKKQLNTTKIDEPKTPYHRPSSITDEIDESMAPLNLEDNQQPISEAEIANRLAAVHEDFESKRKQHYNMSNALQQGKKLVETDPDMQNNGCI
eukprot:TRINITY_DN1612_c1_g1_i1.p2 TRINITY_DN1612_c1_g1~~TRINITY_DN1612_c1_g1_i1.p2  ORF type:complete len:124 (+),score=22.90 TRINITY_DN1612_c1_g1_i1:86-457(+)